MPEINPPKPGRSLPSFVWIILILAGIAVLIGAMIGLFFGLTSVEGFASVLLLVTAILVMRITIDGIPQTKTPSGGFVTAIGILFFALMGLAIDQTGNYIYNLPMQWLFCPAQIELVRSTDVRHPMAGTTQVTQEFTCVDHDRRIVNEIHFFEVMAVRFIEYIIIGYLLLWGMRLYKRLRMRASTA
jgi:hypothetical protein